MDKGNKIRPGNLQLQNVLKLYRGELSLTIPDEDDSNVYTSDKKYFYAEIHNAIHKDGNISLGPGKPLSYNFFRNILDFEKAGNDNNNRSIHLVDPYLLFDNTINGIKYIIWWERKQKREILISEKKPLICNVPAMIYVLKNYDKFFAFALKVSKRPVMTTKLYHPPFSNTYLKTDFSYSNICLGNVKRESLFEKDCMVYVQEYKKYWWNSHFESLTPMLKESVKTGKFPVNKLVDSKMMLKDAFI